MNLDGATVPWGIPTMLRVINCLAFEHDWRFVLLAGLVCFLVIVIAITLLRRARETFGSTRALWIVAAGATTGCGIWSTHFIAMLAYDPGLVIAYDLFLTGLSLLVAILVTGTGIAVAVAFRSRIGAAG